MKCTKWTVPCLAILIAWWAIQSGYAQSAVPGNTSLQAVNRPSSHDVVASDPHYQEIVQQARDYESRGQWADALNLYQQALKLSPADPSLVHRRTVARIHCDVSRRYADGSFLQEVTSTTPAQANKIYEEVLLKIQSYFVDSPDWHMISRYGLTSVQVAMASDEFRAAHLPRATQQQIDDSVSMLAQALQNVSVQKRSDSVWVANRTAQILEQRLSLSPAATVYEFVSGAISALDPYSGFMSGNQYSEALSQIEGNFVGLGVELRTHHDALEIVNVIAGGPAAQGGLTAGDRIVGVDGHSVEKVGPEKAADLLRGLDGSYVSLEITRNNSFQHSAHLRRRLVEIPSIESVEMVDAQSGIGYIRLTNFQKTTARDFDNALWTLHRQGLKCLVLDLRGNPGGLLTAAVEVADRFIASGVIVSTRGRNPLEDYIHRAQTPGTWGVPLVVLIDENSASASEILAAAIGEHHRGVIVGQRSYGKGSVQGIFPLNVGGGGVRLTTAKFYGPSGQSINQVGVTPDVPVQIVAKPSDESIDARSTTADAEDDATLRVAVAVARREVSPLGAGH